MNEMMNQQHHHHHQLMNMNPSLMSMNQMNPHQQQPQVIQFNQNKTFNSPSVISRSRNRVVYGPQMNRSYGNWAQSQQFQNPNRNSGSMKPPSSVGPRSNWKGKKVIKANDKKLINMVNNNQVNNGGSGVGNLNFMNYDPPTLNELQHQNRVKARKFFSRKKLNTNNSMNMNMSGNSRSAPFAPRNTTSFIIRAKRSGGIAPSVSPYPATPAVLPTPILSPASEVLGDMVKEEWGVDGYGSMKGLIRLRSPGNEVEANEDKEEDEVGSGSSGSDVEEHVEVERRLDHDLSRFEMIYNPNSSGSDGGGVVHHNALENRVDDQDTHIAKLEGENVILKQRLFLMERELGELRRRMLCLERNRVDEEMVENESENSSESRDENGNNDRCAGENDVSLLVQGGKC